MASGTGRLPWHFCKRPTLCHHHDQKTLTAPRSNSAQEIVGFGKGPSLRTFAFGFVLLGLCVFAWGLKYKLSLYDPPHALSHRMPAAKLLTGRDRSTLPVADLRQSSRPDAPLALTTLTIAFFALMAAYLRPGSASSAAIRSVSEQTRMCAAAASLFIRPPPSLV